MSLNKDFLTYINKKTMELFEGEQIVNNNISGLTITNLRIRKMQIKFGKKRIESIMIKEIDGSQLHYTSKPKRIFYAFLSVFISIVVALIGGNMLDLFIEEIISIRIIGAILFLFFIILYFISRKRVLTFSTSSLNIDIRVRRINFNEIEKIIDNVEKMKNNI